MLGTGLGWFARRGERGDAGGWGPRKQGVGGGPHRLRGARQRRRRLAFESLEARELLAIDIKQEITQLLGQGTRTGQVMVPDVTVGSYLSTSSVTLTFNNVATQGSGFTGTIGVTAASASLFNDPASGQNAPPFTAEVDGLAGTYNLSTQALTLQATDLTVTLGSILTATATSPTFTYDPTAATPLDISAANVALSSPAFPSASATIQNLDINSGGFSIGTITLSDGATEKVGGILEVENPSITVMSLSYQAAQNAFSGGAIQIGAKAGSLFNDPGAKTPPPFSATLDGFSGSYDLNTQALSLSADDAEIDFGSALMITGTDLSLAVAPAAQGVSVQIMVGMATASVPEFHLAGSINNLTITNDGFMVDSATLALTDDKPITIGPVSIKDPSLTLTNFGYSLTNGASFNSDLSVGIGEADLDVSTVDIMATGISATISLMPADAGHVMFSATSVTAMLGSYLELDATSPISFDTAPAAGGDIVQFGGLSATLNLSHAFSVTGSGGNFAITAAGTLQTLPGFGVTLSLNNPGAVDWPSWLPIQITKLGVTWNDFADDPADFALDLSASINISSLQGTGLEVSGFVQDAIIDVGLLQQGQFPITGISGAGISVGGTLFGVTVKGSIFFAILNTDANFVPIPDGATTPVAHRYFYGGIDAAFNLLGEEGFEIRLGLSQFGPLDGYINDAQTQILDPDSGLAITNFHAGIDIGRTLPSITDPKELATNPGFTPPGQQTLEQWQTLLQGQVASVAAAYANDGGFVGTFSDLAQQVTIDGGATLFDEYASVDSFQLNGDVLISTDGKLEAAGTLTLGGELKVNGALYVDLSQVASGKAAILTYLQAPAGAPIVSAYGGIVFQYAAAPALVSQGSEPPQQGTGITLDGATESASASGIDLNSTSFTVELWAKRGDTGRAETLVGQGDPTLGSDLQIGFDAANNFVVSSGGSTLSYAPTDDNWHEWTVTFDATSGQRVLYEDGTEVASDTAQPITGASTTLLVGVSGAGSGNFKGSVDDIRVWNIARAAADVQTDAGTGTLGKTAGLVAEWAFTEGQGTFAGDTSGNGNTLIFVGTPTWAAPAFPSFTITVSGEVDLTIPDFPAGLVITGMASFQINLNQASLNVNVTGTASITPLGNLLGLAGTVHYDPPVANSQGGITPPDIYGIFALEPSQLSQLQSLGLNVTGIAVLRFNTTGSDQPVTLQVPGQPAPEAFILPAESASLMVQGAANFTLQGQSWFSIDGELDLYFGAAVNASGAVDPTFYAYIHGALIIGPSSAPFFDFSVLGFLQITGAGIAADFSLSLAGSQALQSAGIDLGNDTFQLMLNTTDQAINFVPPAVSNPNQPGTGAPVMIAAQPQGAPNPEPYLQIVGMGSLDILNSIDLSGTFTLLASPQVLTIGLDMQFNLAVDGVTLDSFQTQGGLTVSSQGIVAAVSLNQNTPFSSSFGIGLNASFLLEVNTTGQAQTVGGISLPAGANGPYALVHAQGDLTVGSFDINGSFDFSTNAASTTIAAAGSVALGPLGSINVNGQLTFVDAGGAPGLYGILQAALTSDPALQNFSFAVAFQFEINTTGVAQQVTGFTINTTSGDVVQNQQIAIQPGVMVAAGGHLTIINSFDLAGEFDLTIDTNGLDVMASATLGVFGQNLSVHGEAQLVSGLQTGFVFDRDLGVNLNVGDGLVQVSGDVSIDIDTTQGIYDVAINNASASLLGLTATGSASITDNGGDFRLSGSLNVNIINVTSLNFQGFIDSNGQFSLTASVGFGITFLGVGIGFGGSATIDNSGFSASVYAYIGMLTAGASLSLSGGTFSVSANIGPYSIGNVNVGSASTTPANPQIANFAVPATGTIGGLVNVSAYVFDPAYSTFAANGEVDNLLGVWSVTKNGQADPALTTSATSVSVSGGSGTIPFSFTPDDGGTYQVSLSEFKYYYVGSGQPLGVLGPIVTSAVVVVAGQPPVIDNFSVPRFGLVNQAVSVLSSAHDVSSIESNGLAYSWAVLKNGAAFASGAGSAFAFTPDGPAQYTTTLTVTDPAGRSSTQTATTLVGSSNLVVNSALSTDTPPAGELTLAEAVEYAGAEPGAYTISFDPSLAGQTIAVPAGLTIAGQVTIDGTAAPGLVLSGGAVAGTLGSVSVLTVAQGAIATIQDLTITDGSSVYGGGIDNNGTLSVIAATIENNTADRGGGIYNGGTLTLIDSTVAGNFTNPAATLATTLSGAGIDNSGSLDLIDSTIAGNAADNGSGGGVFDESNGTATLQGTIIATNTGQYGSPDVAGAFVSLGQNLIGNPTGGTGFTTADLQNVNPMLGPLMLQGGPTPTMALLPGSPAIDAGAANPSATLTLPGVFAQYPADGNANDVTGGNNGTIEGNVTYATGVVGQAFQFNGQFAAVALPPTTDIVGTGAFTVSAWIKTTSDGDIIEQRDANNFNGEYVLQVVGGKVVFWTYGDNQYGFNITSTKSVNDGAWHFIVAQRLADGTGQISIDGALDSTQSAPSTWAPASMSTSAPTSAI